MSAFVFHQDPGTSAILAISGDWTIDTIADHERGLAALGLDRQPVRVDVTALGRIDTAGAFLLRQVLFGYDEAARAPVTLIGQHPQAATLFRLVSENAQSAPTLPVERSALSAVDALARIGRGGIDLLRESYSSLSFLGQSLIRTARLLLFPHRIRWTSVVSVMEEAGLNALPILVFLSFFVGVVIAFIGATILRQTVGATVFTIDLVGWSVLREFGVVLTGILLAGRTNSSFTAQIGSMKMRQEIDAMRTLGLDPVDVLVVPRILAMLVMTPLLTFASTLAGLFGGLFVSWTALDISPVLFLTRMQETIPIENFWVGMSKSPVFALIVAIIACRQGLQVKGNVQSLGRATTASVVHAIFLIIVADAVFAMVYLELDI